MSRRLIALCVCFTFIFSNLQFVHAQDFSVNQLPVPGTMVGVSALFSPLALKGLVVNPQKPLELQFIVDTGNSGVNASQASQSQQGQLTLLVKYFLAGLTIPEGDLWVNLSPYEKERMVPEALGQTDLGRDLLAQDYILKQLTASLIYPEKDLGREFWSRVYAKAQAEFGTTNVPVNTFNKVWILPDQAQVFENGNAAYVTKSTLKVMLDEDYLAMKKHRNVGVNETPASIGPQIIRSIILPEIEKEVNTGKNFAPVRQIYQALILAKWYKETIANGLLDAVYTDKKKIAGVNLDDPAVKQEIYQRYLQAYRKGAFNFIKEEATPDGQSMPRKYFSGGITKLEPDRLDRSGTQEDVKSDGGMLRLDVDLEKPTDAAMLDQAPLLISMVSVEIAQEMKPDPSILDWMSDHLALTVISSFVGFTASLMAVFAWYEVWENSVRTQIKRNIADPDVRNVLFKNQKFLEQFFTENIAVKKIVERGYKNAMDNSFARAPYDETKTEEIAIGNQTLQQAGLKDGSYSNYLSDNGIGVELTTVTYTMVRKPNKPKLLAFAKGLTITNAQRQIDSLRTRDFAMVQTLKENNGGIDLNQINVKRTGRVVNVQFDPAQLDELMQGGFEGFTPVIINISRISSPFQLFGIAPSKEEVS